MATHHPVIVHPTGLGETPERRRPRPSPLRPCGSPSSPVSARPRRQHDCTGFTSWTDHVPLRPRRCTSAATLRLQVGRPVWPGRRGVDVLAVAPVRGAVHVTAGYPYIGAQVDPLVIIHSDGRVQGSGISFPETSHDPPVYRVQPVASLRGDAPVTACCRCAPERSCTIPRTVRVLVTHPARTEFLLWTFGRSRRMEATRPGSITVFAAHIPNPGHADPTVPRPVLFRLGQRPTRSARSFFIAGLNPPCSLSIIRCLSTSLFGGRSRSSGPARSPIPRSGPPSPWRVTSGFLG